MWGLRGFFIKPPTPKPRPIFQDSRNELSKDPPRGRRGRPEKGRRGRPKPAKPFPNPQIQKNIRQKNNDFLFKICPIVIPFPSRQGYPLGRANFQGSGRKSSISSRIWAQSWAESSPKSPARYPQTGTQRFRTILGRFGRVSATIRNF